jgi:cytochrome oxidase Cu insertion factor (SCO1/SenC/PrrC family)
MKFRSLAALLSGVVTGGLMASASLFAASATPGLAVGASAPDFVLQAQDGKTYSLKGLLRQSPVVLVFHRSADW